jgi:ElaB/YqjD/DUF883 family membrane-anchored ribosome-binding protein
MKNQPGPDVQPEASAARLSTDLTAVAGEARDLVRDFGGRKLQGARQALDGARSAVTDRGHALAAGARDRLQADPVRAVALAGGVGVLVGLALGLALARR